MDSSTLAILFIVLGMMLLIAEVFIPSGGLICALAVAGFAAALYFAWNAWWTTNPAYWWLFVTSLVLLVPTTVAAAFWAMPRTPLGRRMLNLDETDEEDVRLFSEHDSELAAMVGKSCKTLTPLNPAGLVQVDGRRVHASSEGMIVEANQTVRVISVQGSHILVRAVTHEIEVETDDGSGEEGLHGDRPLDFELPPS